MDKRESEWLFQEADRLYRRKRYEEALSVLEKLDDAFPDTKNIMMPRAMCLAHLGQVHAARLIHDHLAARYPPERIKKLRKLLDKVDGRASPAAPPDALAAVLKVDPSDLEDARITASPRAIQEARQAKASGGAPPPMPGNTGPSWGAWAAIGGGVAVLLALLSLPLFVQSGGESAPSAPSEQPEMTRITDDTLEDLPPAEFMRFAIVFSVVAIPLSLITLALSVFLTLLFFGELPRETFLENFGVLLLYSLFIYVITGISWFILSLFFGALSGLGVLFGFLYAVHATFELGFVRTLIFFGIFLVITVIESPIVVGILRLFYFDVPITFLFT